MAFEKDRSKVSSLLHSMVWFLPSLGPYFGFIGVFKRGIAELASGYPCGTLTRDENVCFTRAFAPFFVDGTLR